MQNTKRTLSGLRTQRTAVTKVILDLTDDINKAPIERKLGIVPELAKQQGRQQMIRADINCVQPEVDRLDKQWAEGNVADVPITVVTF